MYLFILLSYATTPSAQDVMFYKPYCFEETDHFCLRRSTIGGNGSTRFNRAYLLLLVIKVKILSFLWKIV